MYLASPPAASAASSPRARPRSQSNAELRGPPGSVRLRAYVKRTRSLCNLSSSSTPTSPLSSPTRHPPSSTVVAPSATVDHPIACSVPIGSPERRHSSNDRSGHSVFVGDLPPNITHKQILRLFSQASPVSKISIRYPKKYTMMPRPYAFVTYESAEDASTAIREFHQTEILGKPCRVVAAKNSGWKSSPEANIQVEHLPLSLTALAFHDTFAQFGQIVSSKLVVGQHNLSKGCGFVEYATAEQAQMAIRETNGATLDVKDSTRPIVTRLFPKKPTTPNQPPFHNVFFKKIPANMTLRRFEEICDEYGVTTSRLLKMNDQGEPTGTGFANFERASAAAKIVEDTQKDAPDGLCAVRALTRSERERHRTRRACNLSRKSA
ncbi:hypothetical protein MJO28_016088 [Puccinia striiformis f. sp. tritici]|nr:hypothetical protein Pst134EA_028880 [Puccinia striiformis f. sp. tritici]KAI9623418.1 hypothetical protein H4Q26_014586 [Puccinia striiformis f. sp. tritici PST-130]KNF05498.1 hypothetical protein PSTG_01310 [Puccinia striiformis f. sp. tritici PST-78]POW15049.1 hypothetical protein PSHT_07181 [Puccinia striiformis]KAH9440941.1 hypothetical protein Pst134EB_029593 [Puccinia striiformis f. sp. tritici]KAH9446892.1 hypothetical protein Pst134EA_028880 [Puccinia striiformis f. sp. tritici]